MDFLGKFNQTFKEFVNELTECFPDDSDFKMYKLAITAAMMMNPTLVIGVFKEKVIDLYADKILAKDDAFFMENTYSDLQGEYSEAAAIIDKLKGYWRSMSADNKAAIWRYFTVLVKLGQRYYA